MMLGSPCSPCCPNPLEVSVTLSGWKQYLHGYNGAVSFNTVDPASGNPYADGQPYSFNIMQSPVYPATTAPEPPFTRGPRCNTESAFNILCYNPIITFTEQDVSLEMTMAVRTANSPAITCTVVYKKQRAGFWEQKFAPGVFYFFANDLFSFSSDSALMTADDVETAAVVQRPQGLGLPFALPLRFHITEGLPEYSFPEDFAELRPGSGETGTVSLLAFAFGGLSYRVRAALALGVTPPIASWHISSAYWLAFSQNGVLSISGIGVDSAAFPGVAKPFDGPEGWSAVQSTLVVTQL
jgi:hypothetical protein